MCCSGSVSSEQWVQWNPVHEFLTMGLIFVSPALWQETLVPNPVHVVKLCRQARSNPRPGWWENDPSRHSSTHREEHGAHIPTHGTRPRAWAGRIHSGREWQARQCSCLEDPVAEDPGGLQSTGLQRAGHNWATNPVTVSWAKES